MNQTSEQARGRPSLTKVHGVLFFSYKGESMSPGWLTHHMRACVAAGAPGKKGACHLFRYSTATLMLDAGADIRYVGEYLRHESLETTKLYTKVSIERLRAFHQATHPAGRVGPQR